MSQITFKDLNLPENIFKAIEELGFENPTEIQAKSIPLIREGKDVIGRSQTGTGKTIAFGIPAIEVVKAGSKKGVQVLIICPTRELALQASDEMKKLSKFTNNISATEVYGGADMNRQIMKLKRANVVIGTPGRIMDHLRRKTLKLDGLKMIILDEADEMLSMGFKEDIETILQDAPEQRQTILFSATMPPSIMALTKDFQKDPELVAINIKQATVDNIEQGFYNIPSGYKMQALNLLLDYYNSKRTIIFANTKRMVDEITLELHKNGFNADGLHGDMKQMQRTKVMNDFKGGKTTALIATDVAARGIDVSDIDLVINYDIPQNTEYYVHRIGRTGRAGKEGLAITMCCGNRQVSGLKQLCRLIKTQIKELSLPNNDALKKVMQNKQLAKIEEVIKEGRFDYDELIEAIKERGYDDKTIIASLMQLYFGVPKKQIEIIPVKKNKRDRKSNGENSNNGDSPKRTFTGDYAKIKINIGRAKRIAPKHIVAAVTESSCLSGSDLGKIDIFPDYSVVGVPVGTVEQVLNELEEFTISGKDVTASMFKEGSKKDRNRKDSRKKDVSKDKKRKSSDKQGRESYSKPKERRGNSSQKSSNAGVTQRKRNKT